MFGNPKRSDSIVNSERQHILRGTVGPRFYPRYHQQGMEDKIGGTLKVGFFKQAFRVM